MSLPKLKFYLVNAFAVTPHGGNQAAVVLFPSKDDKRVDDEAYYSALARDFSLPMTALVVPLSESEGHYAIRWFNSLGKVLQACGTADTRNHACAGMQLLLPRLCCSSSTSLTL